MPECDCRRPTTPDGIYHESTCASRASVQVERNFQGQRDEARAQVELYERALRLVLAASDDAAVRNIASWPERESEDGWAVAGRAARHELSERALSRKDASS